MGNPKFNGLSTGELVLLGTLQAADSALVWNKTTGQVETIAVTKTELSQLAGIGDTTVIDQLNAKINTALMGVKKGVATLDEANGTIPIEQIPASIRSGLHYVGLYDASSGKWPDDADHNANNPGDFYIVSVEGTIDTIKVEVGSWLVRNHNPGTSTDRWEIVPPTAAGKVKSVDGIAPDGDGDVTLGPDEIQGAAPPEATHEIPLKTDVTQITTNKTDIATNVEAIALNTAKTGITADQAAAIVTNTSTNATQDAAIAKKVSISDTAPVVGTLGVWEDAKTLKGTIAIGDEGDDIPQLHSGKLAAKVIPAIPFTQVLEFTVDRIDPDPATAGTPMIIPDDTVIWTDVIVAGWNTAGIIPTGGCISRVVAQAEYNVGETPPTTYVLHETWSFSGTGDWTDKANWIEHVFEDHLVYSWDKHEGVISKSMIDTTVKSLPTIQAMNTEIKSIVELDGVSIDGGAAVKNGAHDGTLYFTTDDSIEMTATEHTDQEGIDISIKATVKPVRKLIKPADIVAGKITIIHNLDSDFVLVKLTDNTGDVLVPGETPTDSNTMVLDVTNLGAPADDGHPWKLAIVGLPNLVAMFKSTT